MADAAILRRPCQLSSPPLGALCIGTAPADGRGAGPLSVAPHLQFKSFIGRERTLTHTTDYNLSARQLECLAWAGEGKTAIEIGLILGISARTAETHLARACATLGVHKRIQAVVKVRELGIQPKRTR